MDRPSSIAARARQRRHNGFRWRSRSFLSLALVALSLAFAHVWENVQVADLRARIERARTAHEQHAAHLRQLAAQLAQWRAQAQTVADDAGRQGFTIPTDDQVCLVSVGAVTGSRPVQLASTPAPRSLWDWLATAAEAEARGPADSSARSPEAEPLP